MTAFHPIIQQWFSERYGEPTSIQGMAWPAIAEREHLLITAPTGSGKTLTAFLWSLNRFVQGELETGCTRILYISPLKALNNDIRRNLIDPLNELRERFEEAGQVFPQINVSTRSGDTPAEERRRMQQRPPEILITTPESLNLMLSSTGGQGLLHSIDTMILDEIHAVVDSKRGVYLMSAVERVALLSGEFQRIALSATINPMETVADFVAGNRREGAGYQKRAVRTLSSPDAKEYQVSIRYPEAAASRGEDEQVWDFLAEDILPRIHQNQSTLIFVNSRAVCEKLTFKINHAAGQVVAYAHHGSLSREIRLEVENRLKEGSLEAIVATGTLEMGIDIGALDEVILVQCPGSISSTIQRIGRAGHQVGVPSRCTIYPTHPRDFLEAAVLADAVRQRALEPVKTVSNPLDVLGQIIISMTATRTWDIDELFAEIRCSTPYESLDRQSYDLVLNMLFGRYEDRHIRELKPRVRIDRAANTIEARRGAVLSLYLSGGVIPDRGYFQLRHEKDNARIGELDEEFVWEARVGQVFALGTQNWQVRKITHNDVIVSPGSSSVSAPPFWRSESISRSFHYAERIGEFLESADQRLEETSFYEDLLHHYQAEPKVADEIISLLKGQREHTRTMLPHRHHLLFEQVNRGPGKAAGRQLVIHTGWGAMVNRPLAMAFEAAMVSERSELPEVFVTNESIVVQLEEKISADEFFSLLPLERLETLLRQRLEGSGFFGARFRENAGRSLLLSKGRFNERKPLWMSRLQSQKLMDAVLKYEDFPILLETWRTCLQDEFDMHHLQQLLDEVSTGEISVSEVESSIPSPFARTAAWDQINTYMYMTDDPKSARTSNLRQDLLQQVVFTPGVRPGIERALVDDFVLQRHRLVPGYAPRDDLELKDWLADRSLIPQDEWILLCKNLEFEPDETGYAVIGAQHHVVSSDEAIRIEKMLTDCTSYQQDLESLLANWLQYYGPLRLVDMENKLGLPAGELEAGLDSLVEAEVLVQDQLIRDDSHHYYCDARNYEFLLRLARTRQRPSVEALPIEDLTAFLYQWQTRQVRGEEGAEQLIPIIDCLRGLPLPAGLWETEVLPTRTRGYSIHWLDRLFQEEGLQWIGMGEKQVAFCYPEDLELLLAPAEGTSALISDAHARYDFNGLLETTGLASSDLADRLWQEAWKAQISNDSMSALRKGIQNNFKAASINTTQSRRQRRGGFNRWRGSMPWSGNWYLVEPPDNDLEAMEQLELDKERARMLLARNGIVFRELCLREAPAVSWRNVFRALRIMELPGEVISGHFFEGIPGPQYLSAQALRLFQGSAQPPVFHINATDPISPSGMGLGAHGDLLPRRIASNYLVFHGGKLVLTLGRRGRDLSFHVEPGHESMRSYLEVFDHLAYRDFEAVTNLTIENINDEPAVSSPYLPSIEACFNVIRDHRHIMIQREL